MTPTQGREAPERDRRFSQFHSGPGVSLQDCGDVQTSPQSSCLLTQRKGGRCPTVCPGGFPLGPSKKVKVRFTKSYKKFKLVLEVWKLKDNANQYLSLMPERTVASSIQDLL